MPCTAPKPSATAAMPAMAAVATGNSPNANTVTDRYTASNSDTTIRLLSNDRRSAACSILARAATANTPGPLKRSTTPAACDFFTAASKAAIALMARCCASVSDPRAAVCATARARPPPLATQTPSRVSGPAPTDNCSTMCGSSPVGSRGNRDFEQQARRRGQVADGVDRIMQPCR